MSTEDNKRVVRAYAEAFGRGDFDAIARLCAPDIKIQGVLGAGGLDVAMPVWRDLHESLGMTLTIEEAAAEGDVVAARFTERGTSRKAFRDYPATGKSYVIVAMEWFRFRDGKIAERWAARDFSAIARQLGWS